MKELPIVLAPQLLDYYSEFSRFLMAVAEQYWMLPATLKDVWLCAGCHNSVCLFFVSCRPLKAKMSGHDSSIYNLLAGKQSYSFPRMKCLYFVGCKIKVINHTYFYIFIYSTFFFNQGIVCNHLKARSLLSIFKTILRGLGIIPWMHWDFVNYLFLLKP